MLTEVSLINPTFSKLLNNLAKSTGACEVGGGCGGAEAAARLARYEALVAAAAEAVTARVSGATDRASPAVWAATRALRSFVDSRSGDTAAEAANTPDKVLAAVAQLTSFLGRDQGEVSVEAEEVSRAQLETFMRGEGRGQSEAALQDVLNLGLSLYQV